MQVVLGEERGRACPESWVCVWLLGPSSFTLSSSSSSSLLELQGPDVLWPARPAFGFLVVAAHCAFQDFVLGRGGARGRKVEREIQRGDLVPRHPLRSPGLKRQWDRDEEMGGRWFQVLAPAEKKATKVGAALATAQASTDLQRSTTGWANL